MPKKTLEVEKTQPQKLGRARKTKFQKPNGDAAMRVFAIPELLENILLLAVAEQMPECEDLDTATLKFSPMPGSARESQGGVCLFSLQRVNKVFYGTITGSAKLKRLIFQAPYDNAELKISAATRGDLLPYHTPLFSLLESLDSNSGEEIMRCDFRSEEFVHTNTDSGVITLTLELLDQMHSPNCYKEAIGNVVKAWKDPEASWRQLKISNARDPVPLTIKILTKSSWSSNPPRLGAIELLWSLQGDDTLEYVWTLFCELLRLVDGRREVIRKADAKYWKAQQTAESEWYRKLRQPRKEEEQLSQLWFSDSPEYKSLDAQKRAEIQVGLEKLDHVLEQWKVKVKDEREARGAGVTNAE